MGVRSTREPRQPINEDYAPSAIHEGRGAFSLGLLALIGVTLLPRVAHLRRIVDTPLFTYHRIFPVSDMYLFDQWAQRIARGDVLGRESYQPLVAWQLALAPVERWQEWDGHPLIYYKAPFYPYLIALLYRLFGDAMLPLAILQIAVAAVSAILLLRIGTQLVGPTAGWMGAFLFALYGPAIHYDVVMLRGPWIVLVSLLATWQLITLRSKTSVLRAAGLGLTLGAALLINEAFFVLPVLVLVLLAGWVRQARRFAALGAALLAGMAIAFSPVVLRNVLVGAPPLALAVTGSVTFAVYNASDSNPHFFMFPASLPHILAASGGKLLPTIQACVASFSGPASLFLFYLQKASGFVIPFEEPDNVNYYYAALKSPLLGALPGYGVLLPLAAVGIALAVRRPNRLAAVLPATAALLLSMMFTLPVSRHRAVFAVYLMPFAGVTIARLYRWVSERRFTALVLALLATSAIAAGAATFQQRVVFGGQPAGLFLYRVQEFALGVGGYARAGRYRDALAELLALLRHNPDPQGRARALQTVVLLRLDKRDPAALREFLRQATGVSGRDAEFLMAVGDLSRQRLRDRDLARSAYELALTLHPSPSTERALRRRLGSGNRSPAVSPLVRTTPSAQTTLWLMAAGRWSWAWVARCR